MNEALSQQTREGLMARAAVLMDSEPNFGRFLRATVEATDPEDFAAYSPEVLEAILRRSFEQLGRRELATHKIHQHAPEGPNQPEIVEIFSVDMPFIVDSALAAIRATGGSIRLIAHPVLRFDPATYRVLDQPAPGSRLESFLHVHLDPLDDDAARRAMLTELNGVMLEVARVVAGWRPMLDRLHRLVQGWHDVPPPVAAAELAEAMHFLGWLAEHNFTFLGMREYAVEGEGAQSKLVPLPESGLGLLEDPSLKFLRSGSDYVETTAEHRAFLASPEPLLVTKANLRARVHSRSHMDYVGIKLYDELGKVKGELRVLGLFTSSSLATPHSEVPLIRRKIAAVLQRAALPPQSHAHKALVSVLQSYPRAELFQISIEQLCEFATTISTLQDRPRVRVLSRIDRFDNYVSILLYMPRDRYDSDVRARIGDYLARVYDGRVSAYYPSFPEGELVRVHFIIGRVAGPTPRLRRDVLEREVTELSLSFADKLRRAAEQPERLTPWLAAFPPAYQSAVPPETALADIAVISALRDPQTLALRLGPRKGDEGGLELRVYHQRTPIPLSNRVPMLENFGFRVVDERTYTVEPAGGPVTYIHDMVLAPLAGVTVEAGAQSRRIEDAIIAVWRGEAESDGLNQLTSRAGLSWRDVEILRAFTKYLRQIGIAFSRSYLTAVLAGHPDIARALIALFHARHDPGYDGDRKEAEAAARGTIAAALDAIGSLDEDRILRRFLNVGDAVLRTSAYQRDADGRHRPALALKFDPARIAELPQPVPFREVFVYSPRLEGLHLRFGRIARGGLRWSDRPEDFRTEVLGLVKAQQVKNAIIVPVGAKGAFVPKRMPAGADREATQREGAECYKIFVSSLLDITDNLEGDTVVPPPNLIRHDGDDHYLVVAADKGTARFSDLANAIALERGYWLGDAFASGGSMGYDHKEMGITARGGWEAVKRHFRELDRDIQTQPFTAVGVGDMSGDVFGNAMLLSRQTRLIAAFDHRDIFIDPDPDPEASFAERQRLFGLPRSSWQDYNRDLISRGGGVFSRNLKNVALFAEARRALGLGTEPLTPDKVIAAILRAEVDLLWFGGIGTYVRASDESQFEVGDKANDAVRVTGREVRAKVIGEGANLAVTQRGRVEYAQRGGRINTDAIDNSAGVNSSDLEVNIKIALGSLVRSGHLTTPVRNDFLTSMTEEVAALCLRNNYLQTLAISVAQHRRAAEFPEQLSLIQSLEARGLLDRRLEFLPDDQTLLERSAGGRGLTRPELAVLLAYAKLAAYADLLETTVPDDPYLGRELFRYFPDRLVETFPEAVANHRLRREVIATVLANAMINRGGPAFVETMTGATSADAGAVAAAYAAARDSYRLQDYNAEIDALDGEVIGDTQLRLYAEVKALLARETLWFLRNESLADGLQPLIARYAAGVDKVKTLLNALTPPFLAASVAERAEEFELGGAPRQIARRIAELPVLSFASDIVLVAERCGEGIEVTAGAFFRVLESFGIGRIVETAYAIVLADRFDRMALDRGLANLLRAQRDLTADVLASGEGEVDARFEAWRAGRREAVARTVVAVQGLTEGEMTVSRLSVAAGLLADLARSA